MNQLQKNYDKLTPRERLAAKLAAKARADEREIMALDTAAPKKNYQVTHHYFLQEAWEHLATFHLVEMLNLGCAFYQGQGVLFLDHASGKRADQQERIMSLLEAAAGTIVMLDTAWRNFCELERMDPDAVMLNNPGSGVYSTDAPEAILNRYDTLPRLIEAARVLATGSPDPEALAELVEVYRAALHRLAGEQSGGWGVRMNFEKRLEALEGQIKPDAGHQVEADPEPMTPEELEAELTRWLLEGIEAIDAGKVCLVPGVFGPSVMDIYPNCEPQMAVDGPADHMERFISYARENMGKPADWPGSLAELRAWLLEQG